MPSNQLPVAEAPAETRKVHAALTRSSTGKEDLRELEAGLDSLQSDSIRKVRIDWSRILLPVAALAVLIILWQLYVSLGFKRRDVVPGPWMSSARSESCGARASFKRPSGPRCSAASWAS